MEGGECEREMGVMEKGEKEGNVDGVVGREGESKGRWRGCRGRGGGGEESRGSGWGGGAESCKREGLDRIEGSSRAM